MNQFLVQSAYGKTQEVIQSEKIAGHFDIDVRLLSTPNKDRTISQARAVLCHAAVRRHMMSAADVARVLNLSPSMVSKAVGRAEKNGWGDVPSRLNK